MAKLRAAVDVVMISGVHRRMEKEKASLLKVEVFDLRERLHTLIVEARKIENEIKEKTLEIRSLECND